MANKWTLKKKASKEVIIPNSEVGIYCSIYQTGKDSDKLIRAVLCGMLMSSINNLYTYNDDNKYKYPDGVLINTDKLKEEVMSELKPYIEQVGNKFGEVMKSKGFIKK